MLKISEDTVSKLEEEQVRQLVSRIASIYQPTQVSGSSDAIDTARKIIETAYNFGIEEVFDVERFARCVSVIGLNFWHDIEFSWASSILGDEYLDGTSKVTQLAGQIALIYSADV